MNRDELKKKFEFAALCDAYKRNPDLFIKKLRKMPMDFQKKCKNEKFKILTEGTINEIGGDMENTIDTFMDNQMKTICEKVKKLLELEENAKDAEPIIRPNIEESELPGLEEKYLLEKRDRLKNCLEEAKKKSETAENQLKDKMVKYQNESGIGIIIN